MKRYLCLGLALLFIAPVGAQDAKADFDKLSAELTKAQKEFSSRFRAVMQSEEYREARKSGDRQKARELTSKIERVDMKSFTERFQDGATKYKGTEGAVPFLVWVASRGQGRTTREGAISTILDAHVKSKALGDFVDFLPRMSRSIGKEKVHDILDKILADNPSNIVKAHAHFAKSSLTRNKTAKAEHVAKVLKLAPDSKVAVRAQAPEFEKTRLQIGMTVPDIEGKDLDGQSFKLSDYRGKVVVLDFWGDW